ncbi:MAG TPA: hypothetical protein VI981_00215 [Candidatus Paceibacterota bacterium]
MLATTNETALLAEADALATSDFEQSLRAVQGDYESVRAAVAPLSRLVERMQRSTIVILIGWCRSRSLEATADWLEAQVCL